MYGNGSGRLSDFALKGLVMQKRGKTRPAYINPLGVPTSTSPRQDFGSLDLGIAGGRLAALPGGGVGGHLAREGGDSSRESIRVVSRFD